MICENCGAYVNDDELVCPYCNTENEKRAKEEQNQYITYLKNKKKELEKLPGKILKNTTKFFLYGGFAVIGTGILVVFIVFAFSRITSADLLEKQKKEIAQLEEYYHLGDYDAMCDYYEKVGKNGGSYEKYRRVYEVYDTMDFYIEMLRQQAEYIETIDIDAQILESNLKSCLRELSSIKEMEEFDFPYGEKEGVLYVREKYMEALQEYMLLTKEEIENAVWLYADGEEDYMELTEIAIGRMEEKFR